MKVFVKLKNLIKKKIDKSQIYKCTGTKKKWIIKEQPKAKRERHNKKTKLLH